MAKAENGNVVKVHYTGTFNDDGTVFDSSIERDPLEFTIGSGQVIQGFNDGVIGMEVNQKKTIKIPAASAYGERREELIIELPKSEFPDDFTPVEGQQLQMQNQNGDVFNVIVDKVKETTVLLDANHPLAGRDLNFDIELVDIVS